MKDFRDGDVFMKRLSSLDVEPVQETRSAAPVARPVSVKNTTSRSTPTKQGPSPVAWVLALALVILGGGGVVLVALSGLTDPNLSQASFDPANGE
ncbi:MAG: hypothetical protein ABJ327_10420 [Litoreibacter sp.]